MAVERPVDEKGPAHGQPGAFSSPFAMMRRLSDDMERMFEGGWSAYRFPKLLQGLDVAATRWSPDIEVFERHGEFVVRADLPGMTKDNVKVEVFEGNLIIGGERKEEKSRRRKDITRVNDPTARSIVPCPCQRASRPTRPRRRSRTACSRSRCRPAKCRKSMAASSRSNSRTPASRRPPTGGGRPNNRPQDRNFFR